MDFTNHLSNIQGVGIYPIISLTIFIIFFLVLMYFVIKMKKNDVEDLRNLPFEGENTFSIKNRNKKDI